MHVRCTTLQNFLPARVYLGNTNVEKKTVNRTIKIHKVILEVTRDQSRVP